MLEGLVASLLNRFLGMYIRNFDPKQLNVGIWSGDVKLRDLELRREALDQLKLPINVVEGHLGQLTLKIPWSNLRGQPVQVYIEDVFVLAAPKEDAEWDEEEEERRRQAVKIEKLDSAEMLKERNTEGLSPEEQQKSQSFTDSLVTKIVDNLQITVKNIHVRYEDSISAPGHPFALGLTLKEFSAISTDGNWKPTYIQNSTGSTHKLATLGALAVYWNTDSKLLGTGREAEVPDAEVVPHDEMLDKFREMIVRGESPEGGAHQYILKPVSGQAKIEMDKSGKSTVPHVKAGLIFDEIGLVLDDDQYRDALMMVDLFHYFIRHQEYKKFQPKGVRPKEDPRAWLQFAGNAVLSKIHDRNRRWSWDFFKERRDDRIRYIELFKKKKKQTEQLTPDEVTELNKLEWKSSYEDMRFWRSLARNQLRKENVGVKKTDTAKKNQGWVAWAWGSKTDQEEPDSETTMTEEQRKELYDAIDWDEKTALAESVDLPKDTVKMQINASLNTGSFTLKQNPHGDVAEILSLYFDGFRAKFLQRPESFLANVSLAGLRVNDGTTPDSQFPQIVRVKDAPDTPIPKITLDDENEPEELVDPLFDFEFEKNPLDGQGDLALTGKLKPLEIIWNPHFLIGIIQFFKPPERHMESIGALMESAGATVESLRQQTRAGLEFALEEHKSINAKLDLQAPLIIIPESITKKNSTCLIVDAGHISVNSQLVDRDTMEQVQAKQKQTYTDEDYKRLESLMYDKFQVKLTSTQVLIGPSIEQTKTQLEDRDDTTSMHIVEQINVDFMVELSIIPKAPNLAKVRISGHLPLLHVSASDKKYKSLMRIIDVAIPNFDEEDETSQNPAPKAVEASPEDGEMTMSKKPSRSKEHRQSASFQFATQEAVILQDESEDDETEFQDASHGDESESLKLQQRNFELKFEVDRLQGSLYRSDPDGRKPDQLLVELVAENFSLNLCVRPYDIIIETSLESLTADDYVEEHPSAEFKSIVSSGDPDSQDTKDLIHVKIVRVKKESPEFMPKYEGVETNINVAISTINVVVTRKTLLTLLDFVLITFANTDAPPAPASSDEIMDSDNKELVSADAPKSADAGSVRIKIDLKSIRLILNNDGIRLATLSLNAADVGIFVLGKTLRVRAKLGDLSLLDDINQGASPDSSLRKLITIQGDDLADFRYETFDAENKETYPGYDSSIFLRAGSIKLNFLEEPFRKIIDFLVKFGKMQALFNAARQAAANQASQIQQSTSRFKFDINVKTPIVVFPRAVKPGRPHRDLITAYLGEIYAENRFVPMDDSKDAVIAMKLSAGIRNIRLTSDFYFDHDKSEELELIDKVDLGFQITYAEHSPGIKRPDTEIEGHMTDFNLRISQTQLKLLLELARSVPAAFAGDPGEEEQNAIEDVPKQTVKKAKTVQQSSSDSLDESAALVDLGPELGVDSKTWTKLDLAFHVHTIGLELILAKEDEPVGDLAAASLSKFSLDDTKVKLRMMTDGSLESEFLIDSFTIQDSRSRTTNKFRKIMTSSNKDVQQFMASVTISGGKERNLIAIVDIDSPRVIFALDYIFALQSFVAGGLAVDEPLVPEDFESVADSQDDSDTDMIPLSQKSRPVTTRTKSGATTSSQSSSQSGDSPMNIAFRVNVVDAQVILIANPLSSSSEAIVLGTKQVLLAQQHALTLQISQMGMFLCRMDRFEDTRLRILDDFSLQMSMDSSKADLTSLHIDVEPLVLRLSLRDILLALQIVSRASELSRGDDEKQDDKALASDVKAKQLKSKSNSSLKRRSASGKATSTVAKKTKAGSMAPSRLGSESQGKAIVQKHEEMTATLEGMRVILIGDLHELPILDLSVKNFTATASDWSSNMRADTEIDMYINIYNFAKSSWEPLVEPWTLGLQVAKDQNPDRMSVDLTSPKMLELTVTSATIALASKSFQFLTQEEDVLSKPRGAEAPYRIRNYTGFDVHVWADVAGEANDLAVRLEDGEEGPWRFEDWEKMRENLSPESNTGVIGVRLEGSGFDSVNKIGVNREGETLYSLRPRKDQILHRLLVEITLGADNVKCITLRSPLLVENKTQIPIELGVFDAQEGHLLKIERIAPGESRPAPVGAAFLKSLLVRPDQGFGYAWSTESLWWKDLLQRPTRTMTCKGETDKSTPPFYFQMHATFDRSSPLTNIYPYMRIRLSAPVELENLLPYDFKYRIYDKNTKKDWTNFLRKGGLSPVHVVELSHLLLLSIDMQDTVFKPSEFAIINSNNQEDFRKESTLICKDTDGLALNLRLHYFKIPDSGGSFRVTVYSPYVILNKTGLSINIKAKSLLQQAKPAAGQGFHTDSADSERRKALPYMFAFGADDQRNRALLKVGESAWSRPQSFDAIGSTADVVLPSEKKNTEIHIGITVAGGDGKYKMTKVVTLAPRFVLKNQMKDEINVREPGSSDLMTLKPGALQPLHFLQKSPVKQLSLCFPGLNNQWSSPFNISDLGVTHIKIAKAGQRQKLIRVEILMENATIFLHLIPETKNWPFSMRNESDTEFMFFQANPNLDDEDAEDRSGWRPIRYRLPPRSIMPYAWDYPAAKHKELIIHANGKERHVKLAEIGNLIPMKIPPPRDAAGTREPKIIDLNVAADGPTQTLILSNYKASKSLYKQKSRTDSTTSLSGGFEVKSQDTGVTFRAQLKLAGIGISLVNAQLRELAYVTFRDISFKYSESPLFQTFIAGIKWIQIDNQLYGGIFPIILYPSVVPKNNKETEAHPCVHVMVTRVKDDSYGVLYIKYATLLLQQMTLEIDEDFVFALLDFSKVPGASWSETHEGVLCDENLDIPEPSQDQSGQDIYFELLNIQPMQLDLSFVRTDRVNVEDKTSSRNPLMFFMNVLTMAIGNINDAPVRLNALMLENARVSAGILIQNITNHYSQEALYQVHKVLGSADFLGNPVGLFNNMSSGVADLFYEPYQGFIMADRPEQLGIGIAKGATSFVKKSVFGVSDSFSKFTGSIAKGLAEATMDKQFQDRRRMTRSRNRPKHALYGVTAGTNSLVSSVASGIGGLARKPIEGAEQEGALGFFKGVGKGALGFVTKPAIGVFDLASNVSEGIRNTTTVFDGDGLERVRLPRFIGTDGIVRPYSQREALGQFWLKQLDNGKYFNESYIAHLELPREDVVVMLTYSRIMLIKSKKLTSEWDVPLKDIQTISKERTGLSLTLRGGTNGPFIPVAEESSRNFLYRKIGVAVNEFNKKYKATE
ncbi:related to vacuolar protein sorting-associated protein VPS13 [Phialocephala subalpina]|uniref:Vacuolar protein sorting-associated protein n=1 Tax=Phialocephala subalpina TaxID=576137 RepID=A0A1L7WZG6_9HELO|nr:related to vacuolar protein sorting-associated protein VPS13 [Phialocephala subalpina]